MSPLLVFAAAAALGLDYGWEPLPDGGHEYTIEIEPQLLAVLQSGHDLVSDVPPQLEVRRYRITVGNAKLPRVDGPPRTAENNQPTPAKHQPGAEPLYEATPDASPPQVDSVGQHETEHADPFHDPSTAGTRHEDAHDPDGKQPREAQAPNDLAPATLPKFGSGSKPLADAQPVAHNERADEHSAEKPALDTAPAAENEGGTTRPWLPLLTAGVLLCCSVGANIYLGWIAWGFRIRYRQAMTRLRAATS